MLQTIHNHPPHRTLNKSLSVVDVFKIKIVAAEVHRNINKNRLNLMTNTVNTTKNAPSKHSVINIMVAIVLAVTVFNDQGSTSY